MRLITADKLLESDRHREYRQRKGDEYRARDAARKRVSRASHIPEFIGVDSEGFGRDRSHRTVLLGVGEGHYVNLDGLNWQEVFGYLYDQFQKFPRHEFVGFYLGYDFDRWLKSLPERAAIMLMTKRGRAARKPRKPHNGTFNIDEYPVRVDGWEIKYLPHKYLYIRPMVCDCYDPDLRETFIAGCKHKALPWMHICDTGSFFQMPFLAVIDKKMWEHDPDGWVCTQEEYDTIKYGKENLRELDEWDPALIGYNQLENIILARVMHRIAKAMHGLGIRIRPGKWFGPGSSASAWLALQGMAKRVQLEEIVPDWFDKIAQWSYYGGWFEIFSHGLQLGSSWNYDINNAYPYAIEKLPCLQHGKFLRGKGPYLGTKTCEDLDDTSWGGPYVIVDATVYGANDRIGPMPYRRKDGGILRPRVTRGWYWRSELQAANRAGLVEHAEVHEWAEYIACKCACPLAKIRDMYNERLASGKNSAKGMVIKLTNNSGYGKFAQNVGSRPYGNWFYASYITAHCRTQILDAIATHPNGPESVLMVATDGICFDSIHPRLPVSMHLGDWEKSEYTDLALFKPGVYWHKTGLDNVLKVKTRGVPKKAFVQEISTAERTFRIWDELKVSPQECLEMCNLTDEEIKLGTYFAWPRLRIPVEFSMVSCVQALNRNKWSMAGRINKVQTIYQDSDPMSKRRDPFWNHDKNRIDSLIHDVDIIQSVPYAEADAPKQKNYGTGYDNGATQPAHDLMQALRDQPQYGYDIEWVTVWNGGPV